LNKNVDIIYYITDLTSDTRRKHLLKDETKNGLINLVSETFKKPLFRIFLKENEKHLLEEKLHYFRFYDYNPDEKFGLGDYLLQMEEAGEL